MNKLRRIVNRIVLPGVVATSTMTLFSYAVACLTKQQFREPVLLHYFTTASYWRFPLRGWSLHYLIGLGFAGAYRLLWKRYVPLPPATSGLGFGAAGGLVGMLGWRMAFATYPSPPRINLKAYLKQLFAAHLIFGLTLSYVNRQLQGHE